MKKALDKNYLLVSLVSFSFLVFEFLLSKELMFLYGMEVSFWVIPLIMGGFSLGSAMIKVKPLNKISLEEFILSYVIITVFSLLLLVKLPIYEFHKSYFYNVFKLMLILIWPFITLGLYFGRVYSEDKNLGKVFLYNGLGLTLGALYCGKIYKFLGWPGGIFFIVFLLLIFLVLFDRRRWVFYISGVLFLMLVYKLDLLKTNLSYKFGFSFFAKDGEIIITRYSELVRTDVVKVGKIYRIFNDGGSPTRIVRISHPSKLYEIDKNELQEIPFCFGEFPRVLIIGSGGGNDVYLCLMAGAENIKAIELNPVIIQLMKNEFRDYSGNIYFHPKVEIINKEGRDYIRQTKEKFDLILLKGTDTNTSFSSFYPFTLEAYLYTKEALKQYWDILSDNGCLVIMRSIPISGSGEKRGFLQMLQLYMSAKSLNLKDNCIIMKRNVATEDNLELIRYTFFLFKNKMEGEFNVNDEILYLPERVFKIEEMRDEYLKRYNVNLLRDDCPAVYNFEKWQKKLPYILKLICIVVFPAIILLILGKVNFRKVVFYLSLGIGYIALELNLMGKLLLFLGHPVYSLQIILSSFLLFGGCGGYWALHHKINLKKYIFLLVFFNILSIFTCNWLYTINIPSQILKNILVFSLIAPLGFFSVVPFSQSLSKEEKRYIMYALDGMGTVVGTILIGFIQTYLGFSSGFIFIGFIYFLAILVV